MESANSLDRGDADSSSLGYSEFFSVLMHYYGMSMEDINHRSRTHLFNLYQQYPRRACERLGVSCDDEDDEDSNITLKDSDYPSEFKKPTQAEREKYIEESQITDEEFLSNFPPL